MLTSNPQLSELYRRYTILYETMHLVRQYPDFDDGGPLADAMDQAMRGERPAIISAIEEIHQTYGSPSEDT